MRSSLDLEWADGVYTLALPLPRIFEIERKCASGLGEIKARLLAGTLDAGEEFGDSPERWVLADLESKWRAVEVVEIIRQALIGGNRAVIDGKPTGVSDWMANKLIDGYVNNRPLELNVKIAISILHATIVGFEPPKKAEPVKRPASRRQTPKATKASSGRKDTQAQ